MAETHTLDEDENTRSLTSCGDGTEASNAAITEGFTPLTLKMIIQLAAPHTWPAAILPVLVTTAVAATVTSPLSIVMVLTLLIICILMQAAVNTINDYYDFVKGADSEDNQDDPTDAVLVYNNVNPKSAFRLALAFLIVAFAFGCYVIYAVGWVPLVIGVVGALMVVLYSAGKSPISYLPIGEYVSGITMGGLIPLACYQALTGTLEFMILLIAFPIMCGIGLIMFTNNTCDIDKDIEAGRKTQAVLLGYARARTVYHGVLIVWCVSIVVLVAVFFTQGLLIMPFMLLLAYPTLSALYRNPLKPATRGQAMPQCLSINVILGIGYTVAILFDSVGLLVL